MGCEAEIELLFTETRPITFNELLTSKVNVSHTPNAQVNYIYDRIISGLTIGNVAQQIILDWKNPIDFFRSAVYFNSKMHQDLITNFDYKKIDEPISIRILWNKDGKERFVIDGGHRCMVISVLVLSNKMNYIPINSWVANYK